MDINCVNTIYTLVKLITEGSTMRKLLLLLILVPMFLSAQINEFDKAQLQVHLSVYGSTELSSFDLSSGDIGFLVGLGTKLYSPSSTIYIGAVSGHINFKNDGGSGIPTLIEGRWYLSKKVFIMLNTGVYWIDNEVVVDFGEESVMINKPLRPWSGSAAIGLEPLSGISINGQIGVRVIKDKIDLFVTIGL